MRPEANVTTWPLPLREHPTLTVQADMASLAFIPIDPGEYPRVFCAVPEGDAPRVDVQAGGGTTRVTVGWESLRWGFWRDRRRSHLVFCIPDDHRLHVHADAARIEIARLRFSELDVAVDTGDLHLDRVEGRMKLATDTGRIVALDIAGSFEIRTDAGMVRVRAARLDPGTSSVLADMGTIEIDLAAGVPVLVDAKADMGAVRVDVPRYTNAASAVVARSSMGFVRVGEFLPTPPLSAEGGPYRVQADHESVVHQRSDEVEAPRDEIDRVVGLVVAGRITAQEAELLLAELNRGE
jgi:hypothetical protein